MLNVLLCPVLQAKCTPAGGYHAVLGDREKVRDTFRELIIFDDDQVSSVYVPTRSVGLYCVTAMLCKLSGEQKTVTSSRCTILSLVVFVFLAQLHTSIVVG